MFLNSTGCTRSEEHKSKISASLRGHPVSAETRALMSAAKSGAKHLCW
jgi:hypothetical protein